MDEIESLLSRAGDAAFVIDQRQEILFWNDAAKQLLGYEASDARGRCCWQLLAGLTLDGRIGCHHHCRILKQVLRGELVRPYDLLVRHANGDRIRVNISTISLEEATNAPLDAFMIHLCRGDFPDPASWRNVENET